MKRAVLLSFVVILAMAQQVSAAEHGISLGGCNDYAWASFEVGAGHVWSTFVGVRLSDGKKVVVEHYLGFCGDVLCGTGDSINEPGILWKNHYVRTYAGGIYSHFGGC